MINSSIANIQTNKSQINTMDTQLSTQKKINKPSDDPIIAIRALRHFVQVLIRLHSILIRIYQMLHHGFR